MRRLRLTPRRIAVVLAATVGISAGVAYAATLSVTSWHLWAGSQALTKSTCTLTGTAQTTDADVVQATANTSNTTGTTMLVKSNAASADWSFVLFNLSSCAIPTTGGADSATLTLFITTAPSNRTITVTPVLTSWLPSPTWNTAQTYTYGAATTSFTTGATGNTAKSATVTVDVDALIKNSSANFGWRLSDTGGGNATTTFATSENVTSADRPKLVINYEK